MQTFKKYGGMLVKEEIIRIEDIIDALKSKWQMIVIAMLITTIIAAAAAFFFVKPKYEASTKLFIGKEASGQSTYNSSDVQMYQNILKTYVDIIKTDDLINSAIEGKDVDKDSSQIKSSLTVEPLTGTQIIKVSYVSTDKNECKTVVENIANEFVSKSTTRISNADVQIIDTVKLPQSPISPNKKLYILVGALVGLLAGCVVVILQEFLDNTFKDKEQVESILDIPVIGVIPNEDKI